MGRRQARRGAAFVLLLLLTLIWACTGEPALRESTPAPKPPAQEEPQPPSVAEAEAPADPPRRPRPGPPQREFPQEPADHAEQAEAPPPAPVAEEPVDEAVSDELPPDAGAEFTIPLESHADLAILNELGRTVANVRGLALLHEVPVSLVRRSDLPAFIAATTSPADAGALRAAGVFYRLLGVLPGDQSYAALIDEIYTGLVLGFYDLETKQFVIVSAEDRLSARDLLTVAHEYTHALQDQNYDLEAAFEALGTNFDAELALRFVAEADARLVEVGVQGAVRALASSLAPGSDRLPGLRDSIPEALARVFNAPYQEGFTAIGRLVEAEGREVIDALLSSPPRSTEQLLNLDKWYAAEPPIAVLPPRVPGLSDEWQLLRRDTYGEYVIRAVLSEELGEEDAIAGAAGWGGDRAAIYEGGGASLILWRLRWDSEAEAEQFHRLWGSWLERRADGPLREAGPQLRARIGDAGAWAYRDRDETWIAISTDAQALQVAECAALSTPLIQRYPAYAVWGAGCRLGTGP